jgi:hypothetical protein
MPPKEITSILPRCHLFELHELPWFPETFRNAITEVLRALSIQLRIHEVVQPTIERILRQTGTEQIVDLCSGAGGPILEIQKQLAGSSTPVRILLTDKFPNALAFRAAEENSGGLVRGCHHSVDATAVPADLKGLRTLFNAFHHFPPDRARQILADAYRTSQPIAIFEITDRTFLRTASNFILSFITMLVLLPRMKLKRPEWWLFTYAVPILPLAFGWDGFVSCLRSYTGREFQRLTDGLSDPSYSWENGRIAVPKSPVHITYFVGTPGRSVRGTK